MRMSMAWLLLAAVIACGVPGCDRAGQSPPAVEAAPEVPRTVELAKGPAKETAGFTHRPDELTPGFPAVLTLDLGPRLRVYLVTERVVPAELTLFDAAGRELRRLRIDLPPGGTMRGPAGLVGPDVGSFQLSASPQADGASDAGSETGSVVLTTGGNLQPDFGVVKIWAVLPPQAGAVGGTPATLHDAYSGSFVADPWTGTQPSADAHWLTDRVKQSLREIMLRRATPTSAPGPKG